MEPKHGHHDDADPLPERHRDALDAQGLVSVSDQSDHGLAKLAQGTRPGAVRVLNRCQGGQHARRLIFQRVAIRADHMAWASCPARRREATGILSRLPLRVRSRPTRDARHAPPPAGRAWVQVEFDPANVLRRSCC